MRFPKEYAGIICVLIGFAVLEYKVLTHNAYKVQTSVNSTEVLTEDVLGFSSDTLFHSKYDSVGWFNHTPYDDPEEFVKYWTNAAKSFEKVHDVPHEVILSKMWWETHGGKSGVGKKGSLFGIKGSGNKGYDPVDGEHVEYQAYSQRWEAVSHFCEVYKLKRYEDRRKRWKAVRPTLPDWHIGLLSLQVDPSLKYSRTAYALCGCKSGKDLDCYRIRKDYADKTINFVKKYVTGD